MKLHVQKRLAADVLNCSSKRIWLDPNSLSEIKEAITKRDIKSLIEQGLIKKKRIKGVSRFRARKILVQKRKGKQKGQGSRKSERHIKIYLEEHNILKK